MEGAPQGIPFDNLVVDDEDNEDEESDKEVDELEGSVPPQPTSVVANVQEQDAIAEDPATRSRRSTKGSESTTTGRPVAASSQVVPDEPRTGPECRYVWHCCCTLLRVRLTYSFQSPLEVGRRIGTQRVQWQAC